jgi:hypothetical protein
MKPIQEMSTAEMVTEYNALTGKAVKKFSSRTAGEQQLTKARFAAGTTDLPDSDEPINSKACPQCKLDTSVVPAGPDGSPAGRRLRCETCDIEFHPGGKVHAKRQINNEARSIGVRNSWNDPAVQERRRLRDKVSVAGQGSFRSVRAAFEELELPLQKHIKFRMELKATKTAEFSGYKFTIIEN